MYRIKLILKSLLILIISVGILSSCKTYKKVNNENIIKQEEQVSTKKRKNKKGNKIGEKIAKESLTWIGTPYKYGCNEKGVATDCSGLVMVVYEEVAGIKLPRNSAQQADFCNKIKAKDIQAGDLVFFATGKDKKKVSHVGVMIDKEKFVHASGSKGVIMSEMNTPYYQRTFIKYGRVPR